jgi:hypothetical protein
VQQLAAHARQQVVALERRLRAQGIEPLEADVAHQPREPGDQPRPLDPKDRVDPALCLARRHGCR